jgi:gliding motility-associated-like protein
MKALSISLLFVLLYLNSFSQINLTTGLVTYHPFNGNTNDASGNAINGTPNNVSLTTNRLGTANSAYYFNSSNSYIELPYSNLYNFAPTGAFTISVWVLPDQGYLWPAQAVVVKSPPHPDYIASLWNYGTYLLYYKAMGGYAYTPVLNGTTTLSSQQCWYHLLQTYENGRWNMYVNGVLESSDLSQTRFILQDGFSKIFFGKKGDSDGDYYKGKMDDVRIYNRVLNSAEIDALFRENNPVLAGSVTQPTCSNSLGSIVVTSPSGVNYEFNINGSGYQTSNTFQNLAQGNYNITARNKITGCVQPPINFTINAPIGVPPAPVTSPITQPNCTVPTASFTVTSPTGAGLEYSINGTNYQASANFSGLVPGYYDLTVRNTSTGCVSSSTGIYINPPPLALGMPTLALEQPTCVVPTATIYVLMNGSPLEYSLNGGSYQSSNIYTSLAPGNYTVTVRNTNTGCISMTATAVIYPPPSPPLAPVIGNIIHPTCSLPYGSIQIASPSGTDLRYSIDGSNFQTSPNFAGIAPGIHNAVIQNIVTGCTSSQTPFTIDNIPALPPTADVIITQQPSCTNATGSILISSPVSSNYEYSINGNSYQSSPAFTNLDTGIYSVTVRDRLNGCESAPASIRITADAAVKGRYYLPNAFTPNKDGLNDCFGIKNWGLITEFKLAVYNRWGEEVFYTTNPSNCWDGTYKGVQQNPGNYVYYIKAVSLCGTVERKGNLALIR